MKPRHRREQAASSTTPRPPWNVSPPDRYPLSDNRYPTTAIRQPQPRPGQEPPPPSPSSMSVRCPGRIAHAALDFVGSHPIVTQWRRPPALSAGREARRYNSCDSKKRRRTSSSRIDAGDRAVRRDSPPTDEGASVATERHWSRKGYPYSVGRPGRVVTVRESNDGVIRGREGGEQCLTLWSSGPMIPKPPSKPS